MKLRVIDFKRLTSHYVTYRDGVDVIEKRKKFFLEKLDPIKKELNEIILKSQSDFLDGKKSNDLSSEHFQDLQSKALLIDKQYKQEITMMSDDLNAKCYSELSVIIEEWTSTNQIDIVIGKMEVVVNKPEVEITEDIIEILKEKELYVD